MPKPPSTDAFAALERREWADRAVARSYAREFAKASDMVAPLLVEAVGAAPGRQILDLCCGHGNVTARIAETRARVVGLDFSAAMLDMARETVPEAEFVEGDAQNTPFPDAGFDGVTMGFGMPHVPDPPKVIAEVRRILRRGGVFAFSVWCGPEVDTALGYVFGAIAAHGSPDITLPPGPGANDYADPDIAFPALQAAGFTECRQQIVASHWRVTDPGAPFDFFRDGTARGGALLRPQPPDFAAAIWNAVIETVLERHGNGPDWHIPVPATVTIARTS